MSSVKNKVDAETPHKIEISVRTFDQLFNTMDPSPFHEKDLDSDAEEFILSWAQEFPGLRREARTSLFIGGLFLAICLIAGQLLMKLPENTVWAILKEGLTIAGWVAMWRPLQMYLYDWWPVRRRVRIFEKMSRM